MSMSMWSIFSSCVIVVAILVAECFCGVFLQAAINLSNSSLNNLDRNVHQSFPNHQRTTWNSGSGVQTFNDANYSNLGSQNWPALGERRNYHQYNSDTKQHSNPSGQNSFVRTQIDQWNSRLNPNNSYANTVSNRAQYDNSRPQQTNHRTNTRPFTGIQFGNNDERANEHYQPGNQRTDTNTVTDAELREFSEELLKKDENNAAKFVRINFQGRTTSRSKVDQAPLPLLEISREAYDIETISKLQPLYDNYVAAVTVSEDYTNQEKQEENVLLKAILNTKVMRAARNFLMEKGAIGRREIDFENTLHDIWFNQYTRQKRKVSSSGFEHVFLAEIKRGDVSGLHNWLYFEREEANHRANYLGYMKKLDLGTKGAILKFNFDFHGINKPVGAMFIGTSPEFEMALYSVCFLLRADKICPLMLNGHRFVIRTYTYNYNGQDLIGSAFPDI